MSRMNCRSDSFKSLCRLCATYDAVKLEIFGEEGKERSLVEKIQTCLPLQVSKNDPLPKSLCFRCMYDLENFYDFRRGCVDAVALLESYLKPDGGKSLDRKFAEKHAKIMKQMRRHASRDSDSSMPQLEPEVPLPDQQTSVPENVVADETSQSSDSAMPELPSAVDDEIEEAGGNTDDDIEEVEQDDDGEEKVIDIDPADYLESCVSEGPVEDADSIKKLGQSTDQSEIFKTAVTTCELYSCKVCGKAFSSKGHLSLHIRIHTRDESNENNNSPSNSNARVSQPSPAGTFYRPYRCDLCNKSYSSSKHLWGHVSSNHRGDPAVTCPECHRLFSSVFNLEEHKRSKHGDPSDEIGDEGEDGSLPNKSFTEVEKEVSKKSPGASKVKETKARVEMADDALNENGKRPASEEAGGNRRKSSKPRKIARAQSNDSQGDEVESQRVQCALCLTAFPSLDQLMEHTKQHQNEVQNSFQGDGNAESSITRNHPQTCLLCDKSFTSRSSLNRHLQSQHGINPEELLDKQIQLEPGADDDQPMIEVEVNIKSECGDNAEDEDPDHHMLAESMLESETVFCCEACIREFTDRSSLWLHMLYTHKEAAASACGLCLKVCGDLESLSLHLQSCHSASQMLLDKRRYSCTICMRQHDSRKKLLSHVLIHDVHTDKPEDLIILNSDLYQTDREQDHEPDEEESPDLSTPVTPKTPSNPGITPNAAVAAAAAAAANSPFACQICLKIFPNEEKMVKHKQNAHRQDALVHATTGVGTYHLFFRCEICGVSHQSKSERWKHVYEQHRGDPRVTCSRRGCEKVFASAELALEHIKHHSAQGNTPNTCEICGKLWSSRVDYWKHMMGVHSEVVPDTCGVCLKVLPDIPQLMEHVRTHHWPLTGGDYCCDVCGRPYSNRSKMSRHRKIHFAAPGEEEDLGLEEDTSFPVKKENEDDEMNSSGRGDVNTPSEKNPRKRYYGNLRCEGCPDKQFRKRDDLVQHRHADHGMLTCDLCDKFYGRTSHLWKHVNRLHRGNPAVTCSVCGKVSASRAHLAGHIAKMHRPGSVPLPQPPKPKVSAISKTIKAQKVKVKVKVKRALGPQACPQCHKIFRNRYRVLRHLKSCTEANGDSDPSPEPEPEPEPVACQQCSKMFDNITTLRKHERRMHVTYNCELCAAGALPSKTALMEHIMIAHRGAEQLTCSVEGCSLVLRCSADREKHENQHKHTGGTPNTCQLCGELYNNRLRLRKHMVLHHKANVSTICGVCLVVLSSFDELKAHVSAEHANILKRPNTCEVCGKTCGSRQKTFVHITRCHGKDVIPCKECLALFKTEDELKKHMEVVHESDEDDDDDEDEEDNEVDGKETMEREKNVESEKNIGNGENVTDSNQVTEEASPIKEKCEDTVTEEKEPESVKAKVEIDKEPPVLNGVEPDQHKCEPCGRSFRYSKDLVRHTKTNHPVPEPVVECKFGCGMCSEKFPNHNLLAEHLTSHSRGLESRPRRSYKCNLCKESFRMPSQLMLHQKQRHRSDSRPMSCPTCVKTFSNKLVFSKHVALCQKDKSSILQQTLETGRTSLKAETKAFSELAALDGFNGHFLDGASKDAVNAEDSEGSPLSRPQRQNRKVYGGNEGPIHCQLCNKVWPALKHQWQHLIRTHREAAATTCGVCLEICVDYPSLSTHLKEAHPGLLKREGNNFTCRICGRYHNARSKLELHNAIHLGMEAELDLTPCKFTCSTCFKVFATDEDLDEHSITHLPKGMVHPSKNKKIVPTVLEQEVDGEDIKLFVCPSCSLVFTVEDELKKHMETSCEQGSSLTGSDEDTNDTVYSCQRCNNATYSSYISLTKHYKHCSAKPKEGDLPSSDCTQNAAGGGKERNEIDEDGRQSADGVKIGKVEDIVEENEAEEGVEEIEEVDGESGDIVNDAKTKVDDLVEEETNDSQIEEVEETISGEDSVTTKSGLDAEKMETSEESSRSVSRKAMEDLVKDIKDLGSALRDSGTSESRATL